MRITIRPSQAQMAMAIAYNLETGNYRPEGITRRNDVLDCVKTWYEATCPNVAEIDLVETAACILRQVMARRKKK